jgi:hypothetical protein
MYNMNATMYVYVHIKHIVFYNLYNLYLLSSYLIKKNYTFMHHMKVVPKYHIHPNRYCNHHNRYSHHRHIHHLDCSANSAPLLF